MCVLETDRLRLRPLTMEDAPAIAGHCANWNVAQWLARVPWPYALEDGEGFISRVTACCYRGFVRALALDGAFIGIMSLDPANPDWSAEDGARELGYWIGEPYWGKGYATEAADAMVRYGFEEMGVEAMVSGALADNARSLNVLTKCGFERTGEVLLNSVPHGKKMPAVRVDLSLSRWHTLQQVG